MKRGSIVEDIGDGEQVRGNLQVSEYIVVLDDLLEHREDGSVVINQGGEPGTPYRSRRHELMMLKLKWDLGLMGQYRPVLSDPDQVSKLHRIIGRLGSPVLDAGEYYRCSEIVGGRATAHAMAFGLDYDEIMAWRDVNEITNSLMNMLRFHFLGLTPDHLRLMSLWHFWPERDPSRTRPPRRLDYTSLEYLASFVDEQWILEYLGAFGSIEESSQGYTRDQVVRARDFMATKWDPVCAAEILSRGKDFDWAYPARERFGLMSYDQIAELPKNYMELPTDWVSSYFSE